MGQVDDLLKTVAERETAQEIVNILKPHAPELRREVLTKLIDKYNVEVDQLDHTIGDSKYKIECLDEIKAWIEANRAGLRLEKNGCSRLHRLKEAGRQSRILGEHNEALPGGESVADVQHTFVVQHNWAAAFEGAQGIDDDFRLPYDFCSFEFRVNGRNVIALIAQDSKERMFTSVVETREFWYAYGTHHSKDDPLVKFMWEQIRAICIALDAEVATSSVVRAPHKLNEKRERSGKPKLADFHVVDLTRRHRVAGQSGSGTGGKKRLHFRRGHWRHFETTKTWIKWCLVGDPDLGFIQKHYSL